MLDYCKISGWHALVKNLALASGRHILVYFTDNYGLSPVDTFKKCTKIRWKLKNKMRC